MTVVQFIRPLEGHLEGLFVFVPLDPEALLFHYIC